MVMQFSAQLDAELEKRGQPAVRLPATALAFTPPTQRTGGPSQAGSAATSWGSSSTAWTMGGSSDNAEAAPAAEANSDTGVVLGVVIGAFAMGFLALALYMMQAKKQQEQWAEDGQWNEPAPDMYASKVAALDNQWMHENAGGYDQAQW